MPFVTSLNPVEPHAFENSDLFELYLFVEFLTRLIYNVVEHLAHEEVSNKVLSTLQLVFILLSGILIFSVQLPFLEVKLILNKLIQLILFIVLNDALVL